MTESPRQPISDLVHRLQTRDLSRNGFIAALTGLGATATGIATILAVAESAAAAGTASPNGGGHAGTTAQHHTNKKLHHAHVQRQNHASQHAAQLAGAAPQQDRALPASLVQKLDAVLADYADDAVVTDPLFAAPFVGKAAIRARKEAEMAGMAGLTITVTHRYAHGDEVVAEWVARGTVKGQFLGLAGHGRTIEMPGVTVVTRRADKVVKEALYYDLAALRRQLG
jgi:steroid delta-isomerase-like uncharacterized protein